MGPVITQALADTHIFPTCEKPSWPGYWREEVGGLEERFSWQIDPQRGGGNSNSFFPKQCGNTWGSYGSVKRPGWLDRGGGRGSVRNSSLFSWFRACMFVSSVNFRSFRGGRADARGFCL